MEWRIGSPSSMENDKVMRGIIVQILHSSFRIERFLRGIQSEAKNLFFIFLGIVVIVNRKMNKLFSLGRIAEKYFTPARGYPLDNAHFYKDFTPYRGSQFLQTPPLPKETL